MPRRCTLPDSGSLSRYSGTTWEKAATGEFGNITANPLLQTVKFAAEHTAFMSRHDMLWDKLRANWQQGAMIFG